eukprot:TRINITY_DN34047_c0_g1_i1.p1 TRINITY_DN34047_c0_g1~~TRINITY_DN34047_c0_g1_i1.p1  ORF type:complete len:192 (+),score=96.95 TRINITY_DN34047_c0_g1_i1:44-619(+)
MQGSIEQMYPRTKADYESYVDAVFKAISKQTLSAKDGDANAVLMLNALLQQTLSEATPEEVKELVKIVDEQCNKKIEAFNKDVGKVKSKLKGIKMFEDGAGNFDHLDKEEEGSKTVEQEQEEAKKAEEIQKRDEAAQADLEKKAEERAALQQKMKKEERKVELPAGFNMAQFKKKDDDGFMFGGKKKGKKK